MFRECLEVENTYNMVIIFTLFQMCAGDHDQQIH